MPTTTVYPDCPCCGVIVPCCEAPIKATLYALIEGGCAGGVSFPLISGAPFYFWDGGVAGACEDNRPPDDIGVGLQISCETTDDVSPGTPTPFWYLIRGGAPVFCGLGPPGIVVTPTCSPFFLQVVIADTDWCLGYDTTGGNVTITIAEVPP